MMSSDEKEMMFELIKEVRRIADGLESLNDKVMSEDMLQSMYLDDLVTDELPQ